MLAVALLAGLASTSTTYLLLERSAPPAQAQSGPRWASSQLQMEIFRLQASFEQLVTQSMATPSEPTAQAHLRARLMDALGLCAQRLQALRISLERAGWHELSDGMDLDAFRAPEGVDSTRTSLLFVLEDGLDRVAMLVDEPFVQGSDGHTRGRALLARLTELGDRLATRIERESVLLDSQVRQHARFTNELFALLITLQVCAIAWLFFRTLVQQGRTQTALEALRGAQADVERSESRYRLLFDGTPMALLGVDVDGVIHSANNAAATHLGAARSDLLGRPLLEFYDDSVQTTMRERVRACLARPDEIHSWEIERTRHDGTSTRVRETARALPAEQFTTGASASGEPVLLLCAEDVSAASELRQQLQYQAQHDELTGLGNRREFREQLQALLESKQRQGSPHVLCFIDLDQFKVVNDTCGHAAGD
ncbi:MAG: diguanylate cyclase, partial [Gammaproteobacteria bacterium]|nr:diguanylate cyclase [Gammaproteobacteria bacterium]